MLQSEAISKEKILVFETICDGYEHANINAALLNNLLQFELNCFVELHANTSHFEAIKSLVSSSIVNRIILQPISINKNNRIWCFFSVLWLFIRTFWANISKSQKVLLLSIDEFNLLSVRILSFFFSNFRIIGVVHSILNYLEREKKQNILKFIASKLLGFNSWFLNFNRPNCNFLILGEQISQHLLKKFPFMKRSIISVHHPYFFQDSFEKKCDKQIKIGFLGVGSPAKGIEAFIGLSNYFKNNPKVKFYLLGKLDYEIPNEEIHFEIPFREKMCSYSELCKISQTMDYYLFVLKPEEYLLRASGTFFDAVNFERPLISLQNPFLDYYFDLFDDIGYQAEDLEKLKQVIENLVQNGCPNYREKIQNLKEAKIFFKNSSTLDAEKIFKFWNFSGAR